MANESLTLLAVCLLQACSEPMQERGEPATQADHGRAGIAAQRDSQAAPAEASAGASSSPAQQRKTYQSQQFGFAFEYPAAWTAVEGRGTGSAEPLLRVRFLSPDENVPVSRDYSPGRFSLEVFANPQRLGLRDWLDRYGWPFGAADRNATATSLAGSDALDIATGKMFAPNRFIYFAANGYVIRVSPLAVESSEVLQSLRLLR